MKQEQKAQIIEAIAEDLANYPNVYVTDISGFTVEMVNQLRRQCFKREIKLNLLFSLVLVLLADGLLGHTGVLHIGLEIHSGQNRVVRRIFEKVGYKVVNLDRVSFAGLTKKNVGRGKWRFLTPKEVAFLQMGQW